MVQSFALGQSQPVPFLIPVAQASVNLPLIHPPLKTDTWSQVSTSQLKHFSPQALLSFPEIANALNMFGFSHCSANVFFLLTDSGISGQQDNSTSESQECCAGSKHHQQHAG